MLLKQIDTFFEGWTDDFSTVSVFKPKIFRRNVKLFLKSSWFREKNESETRKVSVYKVCDYNRTKALTWMGIS